MTWCVDTLKIIGEGLVEKSNLCSFELDLGTFNNFLIINNEFEVVIKVIVFSQPLFESTFFGENIQLPSMHFIKYKEGKPRWITENDINLIAIEYQKRCRKKLKILHEIPNLL